MKRIVAAACCLVVATAVWAGDPAKQATTKPTSAKQLEMMKAEMSKCAVCKTMAARLDEIGPMQVEVVKLNDGTAFIHNVTPNKAAVYHQASAELMKAGEASMTMTDAQAKTELCDICQGFRDVMKAGANMSNGQTKYGDLCVVTSKDPKVQAQIASLGEKCAMMMGTAQATR
jgi:hypothetical protein